MEVNKQGRPFIRDAAAVLLGIAGAIAIAAYAGTQRDALHMAEIQRLNEEHSKEMQALSGFKSDVLTGIEKVADVIQEANRLLREAVDSLSVVGNARRDTMNQAAKKNQVMFRKVLDVAMVLSKHLKNTGIVGDLERINKSYNKSMEVVIKNHDALIAGLTDAIESFGRSLPGPIKRADELLRDARLLVDRIRRVCEVPRAQPKHYSSRALLEAKRRAEICYENKSMLEKAKRTLDALKKEIEKSFPQKQAIK